MKCPQCKEELEVVCNSFGSMLNDDQFDAQKAGDYCCKKCPDNKRGHSGYCYFWEEELTHEKNRD